MSSPQAIPLAPWPQANTSAVQGGNAPQPAPAASHNQASAANTAVHGATNPQSAPLPVTGSHPTSTSFWHKFNGIYTAIGLSVTIILGAIAFVSSYQSWRLAVNSWLLARWSARKDYIEYSLQINQTSTYVSADCARALKSELDPPPYFDRIKRSLEPVVRDFRQPLGWVLFIFLLLLISFLVNRLWVISSLLYHLRHERRQDMRFQLLPSMITRSALRDTWTTTTTSSQKRKSRFAEYPHYIRLRRRHKAVQQKSRSQYGGGPRIWKEIAVDNPLYRGVNGGVFGNSLHNEGDSVESDSDDKSLSSLSEKPIEDSELEDNNEESYLLERERPTSAQPLQDTSVATLGAMRGDGSILIKELLTPYVAAFETEMRAQNETQTQTNEGESAQKMKDAAWRIASSAAKDKIE